MDLAQIRQLVDQGDLLQAEVQLDRLLRSGPLTPAERAGAHLLACMLRQRQRRWLSAVHSGEAALEAAATAGLAHLTAAAHLELAAALTGLGDTPRALDHLEASLDQACLAEGGQALAARAHALLGANRTHRREYAAAIAHYKQAAALYAACGDAAGQARSWREVAWCLLVLDRAPEALPYLDQVEAYLAAHPADHDLANALVADRALCCRHLGQIAASMALCQELFVPGRPGVAPRHRAQGAWVAGLNALDLGRLDEARMFATVALEQAMRAEWPFLTNQAGALRRRVAEAAARAQRQAGP